MLGSSIDQGGFLLSSSQRQLWLTIGVRRARGDGDTLNEPVSESIAVICWDSELGVSPYARGALVARNDVACCHKMLARDNGMESPAYAHVSGGWENVEVNGVDLVDVAL